MNADNEEVIAAIVKNSLTVLLKMIKNTTILE